MGFVHWEVPWFLLFVRALQRQSAHLRAEGLVFGLHILSPFPAKPSRLIHDGFRAGLPCGEQHVNKFVLLIRQ